MQTFKQIINYGKNTNKRIKFSSMRIKVKVHNTLQKCNMGGGGKEEKLKKSESENRNRLK